MTFTPSMNTSDLLTWESQVVQYPATGAPGIRYFAGVTDYGTVDCLLYRNVKREVVGILNHYGFDSPWEQTGNVNVWIREDYQRRGIGTALVKEAHRRWGVNLDQQRFTPGGAALAERLRRRDDM